MDGEMVGPSTMGWIRDDCFDVALSGQERVGQMRGTDEELAGLDLPSSSSAAAFCFVCCFFRSSRVAESDLTDPLSLSLSSRAAGGWPRRSGTY